MRGTEALEMRISLAMVRVDQCVAWDGVLCVVFAIRVAVTSGEIDGVRPGRGASCSRPSIPNSRKRPRQSVTMRGTTWRVLAICLFCSPSLAQLPQFERQVFYFQCRCIEVFTTSLQIRCEQGFAGRGVEARLLDGLWGGWRIVCGLRRPRGGAAA